MLWKTVTIGVGTCIRRSKAVCPIEWWTNSRSSGEPVYTPDVADLADELNGDVLCVDVRRVAERPQALPQREHLLRDGVADRRAGVELIDPPEHRHDLFVATIA